MICRRRGRTNERRPEERTKSIVVPIPEKGDVLQCSNNRNQHASKKMGDWFPIEERTVPLSVHGYHLDFLNIHGQAIKNVKELFALNLSSCANRLLLSPQVTF